MTKQHDPCAASWTFGWGLLEQMTRWVDNDARSDAKEEQGDNLHDFSIEYKESDLMSMTCNFDGARRLGSGNFGTVYRGNLPDGHEVAIKVLRMDDESGAGADDSGFAAEMRVLSKFRHPNLVTLMGWGRGKGQRYLIYELLSGGDVFQRLQSCSGRRSTPFGWAERLSTAVDASCGLAHLHNCTPKAFHRDIKSANILIDRNGTAKMADFGLSDIAMHEKQLNVGRNRIGGTLGYACPHYIKSGRVTEETEMYAFGIVLFELLLNLMPACSQGGTVVYPILQAVVPQAPGVFERARGALDPKAGWPLALAEELVGLALACISMDRARPRFTEACRHLRGLSEQSGGQGRHPAPQQQGWPGRTSQPPSPQCGKPTSPHGGSSQCPSQASTRSPVHTPPSRGSPGMGMQAVPSRASFPADMGHPPSPYDGGDGRRRDRRRSDITHGRRASDLRYSSDVLSMGAGPLPLDPPYPRTESRTMYDADKSPSFPQFQDDAAMSPQCQKLKYQLRDLQQKLRQQRSPQVSPSHASFAQRQQSPFFPEYTSH